ncbi:Os10g0437750, partial [Oryza sativa Japonica Group]
SPPTTAAAAAVLAGGGCCCGLTPGRVTRMTPSWSLAWMALRSQPSGTGNCSRKRLHRLVSPATGHSPLTTSRRRLRTSCTLMCSFLYPAYMTRHRSPKWNES